MRVWLLIAALGLAACESPRKADPTPVTANVAEPGELAGLIEQVESLRDREFKTRPTLKAVDVLPENFAIASDAARKDRAALLETLFGFGPDQAERVPWLPRVAAYDAASKKLSYVRTARKEDVRRDVVLALVDAIDRENFDGPPVASSWDGWLAQRTATMSDAAFVWALVEGAHLGLTADMLKQMPSLAMRSQDVARFLELDGAATRDTLDRREVGFALREGLAFSAALHRSSGWSGAEFAWVSPPSSTGHIVRPDRWAAGEGLGTWTWPATEPPAGFVLEHSGGVGPGVLSMWLSDILKPAIARAIYVTWQSDTYRVYRHNGQWWFELLTFWRTPDDAQQMAEVLDAGLRQRRDAEFSVLRNGATVAIVGATKGASSPDTRLAAASALSGASPTFEVLEKPFITFVPTLSDLYAANVQASTLDLDQKTWRDEAARLSLDLQPLARWTLHKADDFVARFIASQGSATILMSTELVDPLAPSFETEAFQGRVLDNFKRTLTDASVEQVVRLEQPRPATIHARLAGQVSGPVKLAFWMVFNNGVITTFSVKAAPDEFDAAYAQAEAVWKSAAFKAVEASPKNEGVLKFEVEE